MSNIKSYTNNKIALVTAVFTAGFFIFLFLYLGVNLREYIYDDSKEFAKEISRKAAIETEQYFTSALMVTQSMGRSALLIREMDGTREQIKEILTTTINRHRIFLGTWTLWEPNAFDGKDQRFAGDKDHNSLGTLGYGYFIINDTVHSEIMTENDYERPYYKLSKETKKGKIVEPYHWRYSGYEDLFFGTSISLPLVENDEFLGVVGVDIDLINLRERINQIRLFKSGYLSLVSNNGTIINHIDTSFLSKNLFDLINDPNSLVFESISEGKQLTLEAVSEFTGKNVFRFFYPISIGKGKPWSIMVEIPISDATGRTNQLLIVAAIILIVGLGLIIFLIFNILDRRRYEKTIISAYKEVEKYRNHLELLVKERTEELAAANEELQAVNDELMTQRSSLIETLAKLKDTQNQLIQAEKMASLGVLSAGIAHEINNPLNFIHGGIIGLERHFLKNSAQYDDDVEQFIYAIKEGVRRSTEIVRSLNHYSQTNNQTKSDCNIHEIIDNCLMMLNNEIKDSVQIVKEYSYKVLSIKCKEGQIHQAIINILINAIHSFKDDGIITIQTSYDKSFYKISVSDNGCGISKSDIEKITDPFYTTKEPGKGTGLGLSITASIIQDHGGSLEFKSNEGKGTTVTIKLPKT